MNYLAHAYLSFNHPQILLGNMISDFVKGSSRLGYAANVQDGIMLHRAIDSFTDTHETTKEAKEVFRKDYRLYSAPIVDIVFDHFLANSESYFPDTFLKPFVDDVYEKLDDQSASFPPVFAQVFTYMRNENWLYNYRTLDGIHKSLRGLVRRASYISDSDTAFHLFNEHYSLLNECFHRFFPSVKNFAKQEMERLITAQ
jgi:acyl carrier protein phosphodiesterase